MSVHQLSGGPSHSLGISHVDFQPSTFLEVLARTKISLRFWYINSMEVQVGAWVSLIDRCISSLSPLEVPAKAKVFVDHFDLISYTLKDFSERELRRAIYISLIFQ